GRRQRLDDLEPADLRADDVAEVAARRVERTSVGRADELLRRDRGAAARAVGRDEDARLAHGTAVVLQLEAQGRDVAELEDGAVGQARLRHALAADEEAVAALLVGD